MCALTKCLYYTASAHQLQIIALHKLVQQALYSFCINSSIVEIFSYEKIMRGMLKLGSKPYPSSTFADTERCFSFNRKSFYLGQTNISISYLASFSFVLFFYFISSSSSVVIPFAMDVWSICWLVWCNV